VRPKNRGIAIVEDYHMLAIGNRITDNSARFFPQGIDL